MKKHLAQQDRRDTILDAAMDIFCEHGLEAVTIPSLSARTGISRQVIYLHFHSVDEVLETLFDETYHEYFAEDTSPIDDLIRAIEQEHGMLRLEALLDMPTPVQRVVAAAFFCGPNGRPFMMKIQKELDELLNRNWISPMSRIGIDRSSVIASIYTIVASALECHELIERDLMTKHEAESQLVRMIDFLLQNPRKQMQQVD